jgi:peptidoglycan/LPS O-acetylase OafA/YrhL
MKENSKIAGLDTLRFVAFVWVFIGHATPYWKYGYCGIYLFFVLSSFLLTYLSLSEIKETGGFSKKNFFIRRSLRIYPLYFFITISSFILLPVLERTLSFSISLPEKKHLYFLFLSNFDATDHIFALKFLWTISVEEQFYLLFIPASVFFRKYFAVPVILFFAFYFIGFFFIKEHHLNGYMFTTSYFPLFATGMIAGKIFFENKTPRIIILFGSAIGLLTVIYLFNHYVVLENFIEIPIAFFIACIILLITKFFNRYRLIEKNKLFGITEYWGKYTYGLYVYSGFVITFVIKLLPEMNLWLKLAVESSVLFTVAWLSYTYFEVYFIKLKNQFKRHQPIVTKKKAIKAN